MPHGGPACNRWPIVGFEFEIAPLIQGQHSAFAMLGAADEESGPPGSEQQCPLTLPQLAAPNLIVKTGPSFSKVADAMYDWIYGRPPQACSTAMLWKAEIVLEGYEMRLPPPIILHSPITDLASCGGAKSLANWNLNAD